MLIEISAEKMDKKLSKIVQKINQLYEKNKVSKIGSQVEKILENLRYNPENAYVYLYVLSILVEEIPELAEVAVLNAIQPYIKEGNADERANAAIVMGWVIQHSISTGEEISDDYISELISLLSDTSAEVRINASFFLKTLVDNQQAIFLLKYRDLVQNLANETNNEVLEVIGTILSQIQPLMSIGILKGYLNDLIQIYHESNVPKRSDVILMLLQKEIPGLKEQIEAHRAKRDLLQFINNRPPLVRFMDLNDIAEEQDIEVEKIEEYLQAELDEDVHYSLIFTEKHHKKMLIFDKEELLNFLSGSKISIDDIRQALQHVGVSHPSIGAILLRDLLDLGELEGFLTNQYFFSIDYIKHELEQELTKSGVLEIKSVEKRYNPEIISRILEAITSKTRFKGIYTIDKSFYYTFNYLTKEIENEMTRSNIMDLSSYKDKFGYENYLRLEQFCKDQLFIEYHLDHKWLTNLGMTRIQQSIRTAEQLGEADIVKLAKKLDIPVEIYRKVVKPIFNKKNGFWNKNEDIFYFSKFVKKRINEIQSEPNPDIRKSQIKALAEELQIEEGEISKKVDEKLQKIGQMLMTADEVDIKPMMKDLQMDYNEFIQFIDSLGRSDGYIIINNKVIFSEKRIREEQQKIANAVLNRGKRADYLDVNRLSTQLKYAPQLISQAIDTLSQEGKISGIWLKKDEKFITSRGIQNRMLQAEGYIDLNTFFEERDLSEDEILFIEGILQQLLADKQLKGVYDAASKIYQDEDTASKASLVTERERFTKEILPHIEDLERAYNLLREIFLKEDIHPGDIEEYDEILEQTVRKIFNAEAMVKRMLNNANRRLSRQLTSRKSSKAEKSSKRRGVKKPVKSKLKPFDFQEDEEVSVLLNDFKNWKELILAIEQKKGEIVFLKKKLKANPEDSEAAVKLKNTLEYLGFNE